MPNNEIIVETGVPTIAHIKTKKKSLLTTIRRLYFVERWTAEDIAAALEVDVNVVKRYIKIIERYAKSVVKRWEEYRDELVSFLFDLYERHNTRVSRLWNLYKSVDEKSKLKLDIIQQLREEDKYILEILKMLGLDKEVSNKAVNAKIVYVSFKDKEKITNDAPDN